VTYQERQEALAILREMPEAKAWLRALIDQDRRAKILVGLCPACLEPLPESPTKPRKFCSARCAGRSFLMKPLQGRPADYLLGRCG
jgi:hypothetical protein